MLFSHHTVLLEALEAESLSSISLALDGLHAWIDIPARHYPINMLYQKYTCIPQVGIVITWRSF